MTYLDFSNAYGNMCNHFYLAYQSYYHSKRTGESIKYIKNQSFYDFGLQESLDFFNLSQFIVDPKDIEESDTIIKNTDHPYRRYHQGMFVDFNVENLEKFIREVILSSKAYDGLQIEDTSGDIAIHIRNKDYLSPRFDEFNFFNREDYITKCIEKTDERIDSIHVFSDDIVECRNRYDNIFRERFSNITYETQQSGTEALVRLSVFRNKILWNSTFSYWAAFIGNVLNCNSYENVLAPSRFNTNEPMCNHLNPLWRIIYV